MAAKNSRAARAEHVDREWSGSAVTGTTVVNGETFSGKELTYHVVGDLAIFEGDIVLGSVEELTPVADGGPIAFAVAISGSQFRWPGGVVPYTVDPALPNQSRIVDAMAHWADKTVITFVPRASQPNYVHFSDQGGCWSRLGMRGGLQDISLSASCSTGNTIHEIGHTVGLWHEQSREDRNSFVTINYANIDPQYVSQFDQHISDGDDVGPYDYCSIMHYPPNAFSKNNEPTVVPTTPQPCMGQRTALSAGDIAAIAQLYGAKPTPKRVLDDINVPKRFTEDVVTPKRLIDDLRPKSLVRDTRLPKQLRDPSKPLGDQTWRPPIDRVPVWARLAAGLQTGVHGELPFALATPNRAAAALLQQQEEVDGTDPLVLLAQVTAEVGELAVALAQATGVLSELQAALLSPE